MHVQGRYTPKKSKSTIPSRYHVLDEDEIEQRSADIATLMSSFQSSPKNSKSLSKSKKMRPKSASGLRTGSTFGKDIENKEMNDKMDVKIIRRFQTLQQEQEKNLRALHRMHTEHNASDRTIRDLRAQLQHANQSSSSNIRYNKEDIVLNNAVSSPRSVSSAGASTPRQRGNQWASPKHLGTSPKHVFTKTIPQPFSFMKDETLRTKSIFQEEKDNAKALQQTLEKENAQSRTRARLASPPVGIIRRGQEAKIRKENRMAAAEAEEREMCTTFRFKASDAPAAATSAQFQESKMDQMRKTRIMKRAAEIMADSKLPPRMQKSENDGVAHVSSRKAYEVEKNIWKPKPVPDFSKLHLQWDTALKGARTVHKTTIPEVFQASSCSRTDIKLKKAERVAKKVREIELLEEKEREKQRRVYAHTLTSTLKHAPKSTKSQTLKSSVVQKAAKAQKKEQSLALKIQSERKARVKQLGIEITPEIRMLDSKRKKDYTGDFVVRIFDYKRFLNLSIFTSLNLGISRSRRFSKSESERKCSYV